VATTPVLHLLKPIRSLFVRGHLLDDNLEILDAAIGQLQGGGGGLTEEQIQDLIDASTAPLAARLDALEADAAEPVTYDGNQEPA
jgi:hypothetical protein